MERNARSFKVADAKDPTTSAFLGLKIYNKKPHIKSVKGGNQKERRVEEESEQKIALARKQAPTRTQCSKSCQKIKQLAESSRMDKERSYKVQKGREKNRYRWMLLEDKCKL